MAALTTDVEIQFDGNHPPSLIQIKAQADTYFRGGLGYAAAGLLDAVPATADIFAGVIWERKVAASNDLVWIAITGRFFFAAANFTDANYGVTFTATLSSDNPADLKVPAAADPGSAGTLDHVTSTGVSGWLDISRRSAAENL